MNLGRNSRPVSLRCPFPDLHGIPPPASSASSSSVRVMSRKSELVLLVLARIPHSKMLLIVVVNGTGSRYYVPLT